MGRLDNEDEEIPVRSPVSVETAPIATAQDDEDYSTLKSVLQDIEEAEATCGDMNTLDLAHPKLSTDQQVEAYQFALNELILPLKAKIISTIGDVELKRKGIFNATN